MEKMKKVSDDNLGNDDSVNMFLIFRLILVILSIMRIIKPKRRKEINKKDCKLF